LVEVDFGPNEKPFKRYDLLEWVERFAERGLTTAS
jgi:hypothetical protein